MRQYLDLMERVLSEGVEKRDRTGVGTRSIFGHQLRFDLNDGFPLVTTKKLHLKSIIYELLWFLRGDTNVNYLDEHGVTIWDEWADDNGDLGPVYGAQWCAWPTADGRSIDQITDVVNEIRRNPDSRRLIVTAWNPGEIERMALPPCHSFVSVLRRRRRTDAASSISAAPTCFSACRSTSHPTHCSTLMVAQVTSLRPGAFVHTFGDMHLYNNHLEQARLQLSREPRPLPTMKLNPAVKDLFAFRYEDFALEGYEPHPHIKAAVAV